MAVWWLVARGRTNVWRGLAMVIGVAGVAAVLTGRLAISPRVSIAAAAAGGVGSGLLLFVGTAAFSALAVRLWPRFRVHAERIYEQRFGMSLLAVLGLALGLAVTGEELFWRGLAQTRATEAAGRVGGAAVGWGAYVVANLPSANLAILAGAVVGGAVWAALAAWTGGVLAPLLSHLAWTGLMILLPPVRRATPRPLG